jgi:hypothetical protein
MFEELVDHADDRRSSARRCTLSAAPGVDPLDPLDQRGHDPNVDVCCFSHAGKMGHYRASPLDNFGQKIDSWITRRRGARGPAAPREVA